MIKWGIKCGDKWIGMEIVTMKKSQNGCLYSMNIGQNKIAKTKTSRFEVIKSWMKASSMQVISWMAMRNHLWKNHQ